jgi:hypothetical protein
MYDYHEGKVDEWDRGGYVGAPAYQIKAPSTPAFGISFLYPYKPVGG